MQQVRSQITKVASINSLKNKSHRSMDSIAPNKSRRKVLRDDDSRSQQRSNKRRPTAQVSSTSHFRVALVMASLFGSSLLAGKLQSRMEKSSEASPVQRQQQQQHIPSYLRRSSSSSMSLKHRYLEDFFGDGPPEPGISPTDAFFTPTDMPSDMPSDTPSELPSEFQDPVLTAPSQSPVAPIAPTESPVSPTPLPTPIPTFMPSIPTEPPVEFSPDDDWFGGGGSPVAMLTPVPNSGGSRRDALSQFPEPAFLSDAPSEVPTDAPSIDPVPDPTPPPSPSPTEFPITDPTLPPVPAPTPLPTAEPTPNPTPFPTNPPVPDPTPLPTPMPIPAPTRNPTPVPTPRPSQALDVLTLVPVVDDDFFPTGGRQSTDPPVITVRDTELPSDEPSQVPSELPSSVLLPTLPPVPSPTTPPVTIPTAPLPTFSPPIPSPIPQPSPLPTNFPTFLPQTIFTPNPTPMPTRRPTAFPTFRMPTQFPTPLPTRRPSRPPVPPPTPAPTFKTTTSPSSTPSIVLSQDPTPSGTLEPTLYPSSTPTMAPTISAQPSFTPTTAAPSVTPSDQPSYSPTNYPSPAPSGAPSSAPSLPLQREVVQTQMALFPFPDGERLMGRDRIDWEAITESQITKSIRAMVLDPTVNLIDVRASIEIQIPAGSRTTISSQGRSEISAFEANRRSLQFGDEEQFPENALVVVFDVFLDFKSESKEQNVDSWVFLSFDESLDRAEYVRNLQQRSATFLPVEDVEVDVAGYVPPPTPAPGSGGSDANVAVIVGASVGSVALAILVVLLAMRRRSGRKASVGASHTGPTSQQTPSTQQNVKVSTEILVEPQDDVSTLGDPMFGAGGMMMNGMEKDEVTASVGDDYDYTKAYRRDPLSVGGNTASTRDRGASEDFTKMSSANSASMSKLGKVGDNLFADDGSFEQQFVDPEERFDVVAPAGKLGMVIDTPNGGVPVVHAIKETSVLADQVRVGDRLMSVDGEDCTGMTAMQVSKLISLKSEKPARVLIFSRSTSNPNRPQ